MLSVPFKKGSLREGNAIRSFCLFHWRIQRLSRFHIDLISIYAHTQTHTHTCTTTWQWEWRQNHMISEVCQIHMTRCHTVMAYRSVTGSIGVCRPLSEQNRLKNQFHTHYSLWFLTCKVHPLFGSDLCLFLFFFFFTSSIGAGIANTQHFNGFTHSSIFWELFF